MISLCPLFWRKETAEDAAVNKAIEEAAKAAVARTERVQPIPEVTMREGEKLFTAASDSGADNGKEHVTTEAELVASGLGGETGKRVVDPDLKQTKIPTSKIKVRTA